MRNAKKKKSRKLIVLLLTIAMSVSLFPMSSAMAFEDSNWDEDTKTLTINNNSEFDDVHKADAQILIIKGEVTEIPKNSFKEWKALKTVEILSDVEIIGGFAFSECTSLESVLIPESVITISENAFQECSQLKMWRYQKN